MIIKQIRRLSLSFFVVTLFAVMTSWAQEDQGGVFEEIEEIPEQSYETSVTPTETKKVKKAAMSDEDVMDPSQIDKNEVVRRREKELAGEQLYTEGRKAFIDGDYESAVRKFITAQIKFNEVSRSEPRILKKQELVDQLLAYTYEEWGSRLAREAQRLSELDKFEEAVEKFQKVIEKDPSRKQEVDKKVQNLQRAIKQAEFREKTSPRYVDPEKAVRDKEVDVKFQQGKVYFENKRYSDAREMFEQVLLKDPYNDRATRLLRLINEKLLEAGKQRREVMNAERIAEIKWKWNDPVTPLVSPDIVIEGSQPVKKFSRAGEGIWAKLENIIIPKISFEEATIHAVIKYLKTRSRELDPDGEGVNIFLQLAVSAPVAEEEEIEDDQGFGEEDFEFEELEENVEFEDEVEEDAGPESSSRSGSELTITMDFDNIPLGEAIRYICQGAGLKYKVETHAVIIASQDIPFDEMETRFYPVEAGFLRQKPTRDAGEGFDGGGESAEATEFEDPITIFQNYGVEFPQGAKITYDQRTSKLIATNTPSNLRKVEKILAELNIQPIQVTIEAKFVEISQTDLEELGFEWLYLGDVNQIDGFNNVDFSDNLRFQLLKQSTAPGANDPNLSGGLRFFTDTGDANSNDRVMSINSILGDYQFNTILRALEQKESSDILSAPKVTTISGETAVLKVIDERSFPESYTEPELQAATAAGGVSQGATIKPSTPEFGDVTEVGVILTVTPTVASDGYSIDLDLQPEVVQFIGFDDYSYEVTLGSDTLSVPLRTPILSKRQIRTKVIVWDGETVVLGGMITENIKEIEDRIPFLGDLPVFGRLFRNQGQKSEKRNLLIFVTARLVNPAGLPVRTADIRGLPDFRR